MAEPQFTAPADDDLPRTLRRAKEEREARDRAERGTASEADRSGGRGPSMPAGMGPASFANEPYDPTIGVSDDYAPVTVSRLDIPFLRLMLFFIKAVFAAIPALIILAGLLWLGGQALKIYMPWLIHAEILIRIPN